MAQPTPKLRLLKPLNNEKYDLQTLNQNFDDIDEAFGNLGADRLFETSLAVGTNVVPTTNAAYTPSLYRALRWGNWCYLRLQFTLVAARTVNEYGELKDWPTLGELAPKWHPLVASPLSTLFAGRGVEAHVSTLGGVAIHHATGTTGFSANDTIDVSGWYLLKDGI